MKPDLKKALEDALNEKVEVKKGDKEVVLSKAILGIQQLVNQFAKGDRYARRDVFEYAKLLGVDLQGKELVAEIAGRQRPGDRGRLPAPPSAASAAAPDDTHVKAPPDLLDDDAAKAVPEQAATEPAPPRRTTKMPVEPVFDENGVALPVTRSPVYSDTERAACSPGKRKQDES